MYVPAGMVPPWLALAAWAVTAVVVAISCFRLRRREYNPLGIAGVTAFLTSLRLLEFPLHAEIPLCGCVMGVGFAVVVWGPEIATLALAFSLVSHGLISLHRDPYALGVNLFIQACAAPWLLWAIYAWAKRRFVSDPSAYVIAFLTGAAGGPVVAALSWLSLTAAGIPTNEETALYVTLAGLTLTVIEGVLAAWGYTFGLSRRFGSGKLITRTPKSWRGGWLFLIASVVIAAGVAPFIPPFMGVGGALGPALTLAREIRAPYPVRVVAGGVVVLASALSSFAFLGLLRLTRARKKTQSAAVAAPIPSGPE